MTLRDPIRPPRLRPGDTIGIVSPSHSGAALFPHRLERGIQHLESLGYRVTVAPHALNKMAVRSNKRTGFRMFSSPYSSPFVSRGLQTSHHSAKFREDTTWPCRAAPPLVGKAVSVSRMPFARRRLCYTAVSGARKAVRFRGCRGACG